MNNAILLCIDGVSAIVGGSAMYLNIRTRRRIREHRRAASHPYHPGAGSSAGHSPAAVAASAAAFGIPVATAGALAFSHGARPDVDLPVEHRGDAVLAWKAAYVVWRDGRWMFHAIAAALDYGADAQAVCPGAEIVMRNGVGTVATFSYPGRDHEPPEPDCSCGFYALAERDGVESYHTQFVLRVELSGRVIEHEHGYRAKRQRVLGIVIGPCFCGDDAVALHAVSDEHGEDGTFAQPVCKAHASMYPPIAIDEVLASLGVERQR